MKAVVLAGGEGTDLRPITQWRPKPLVPILNKWCIDYVITSLTRAGAKEIIIATGYMSDAIIQAVGDGSRYKTCILYSFEQTPMGTAGAVKKVGAFLDDTFIVASGDVLADLNIRAIYNYHRRKKALATMALVTAPKPYEFGMVAIDNENRIIKFKEKPKPGEKLFSKLINAGIYVFEPEVLDYIPTNTWYDFALNVFPAMLKADEAIYGAPTSGLWLDLGRPSDLLRANKAVMERTKSRVDRRRYKKVDIKGKLVVGKGTVIEENVKIRGYCYIGKNCKIGMKTTLEDAYVLDNVTIDHESVIRNSIIMSNTTVGWRCRAKESIISEHCVFEDDVKISGSVIGDNVTIKIHLAVKDALVDPGSVMVK
jgi:mannose-1-phosphate guanylyltransferase